MWCHETIPGYWLSESKNNKFTIYHRNRPRYEYDTIEEARNYGWYFWEGVL